MELSRRRFAVLGTGVAAGTALGPGQVPGTAAAEEPAAAPAVTPAGTGAGTAHSVTFDPYSLIVDGARLPVWSGEFHPFRLPSPSLWRDVLQKFKASGYSAVSIYVAWNYHSPAPGVYDFTGVRDLGAMLDMAAETGLFVIVRPGPYINAEVDAGGYPGWLTATAGRARTDDPTYLGHVDEWLTAVDAVVAPRQYTNGGGTVLLYQLENEYASHITDGTGARYMAHLYGKVRADGIEVPLFHNDKGRNGYWVPGSFSTGGETGRYLYAFDGYPSPTGTPVDWGYFGPGGTKGGSTASPGTPGFLAEFGGGWFDCWGGAEFNGQGYAGARSSRDAVYERRAYLTNLANGIKLQNVYMTFGGTSWGWLPAPVVYTSYDYGAAIDEARNLTSKITPMKQIGHMLTAVPDLGRLDRAADVTAADPSVKVYHLVNSETSAHAYLIRNDTGTERSTTLPLTTADGGSVTVAVRAVARDAKVLLTGIAAGSRTLRWTTAQPMTQDTIGRQDVAVLVGRPGDPVDLALECAAEPRTTVLDGAAVASYDAGAGLLRITATLSGLTRLLISGGGTDTPLLLLLADDTASAQLWRYDTPSGPVLVRGPALVRTAQAAGATLHLTGDTTADSDLEVWAPRGIDTVFWNRSKVAVTGTSSGSLAARDKLAGPPQITLPALTGWRRAAENPESAPDFDDSAWTVADKATSFSTTKVPAGGPVLFADDYGFHYGDVWYRATWTGPVDAANIALAYQTGTQGALMAWLDGAPLGTHRMPVPTSSQATTGTWAATATFALPAAAAGDGTHVLAVLVRRMAHEEDGGGSDSHKSARGLVSAAFTPAGATAAPAPTWRLQGAAATMDPARGPMNTGGLYGERNGWHLPALDDSAWQPVVFPYTDTRQGVAWYRTSFRLTIPHDVDASLGLTLTDDPARAYRAQIFLNGWNIGQYINDVGPQHTFVLPAGLLDPHGRNTLALAVLTDGTDPAGPGTVTLTAMGTAAGGTQVDLVPTYDTV
ncbi:glycoside hydrolase family 35 protein [Actinacidiphila acididurans]|uniref:beta-galactosidase n=1 Tax=Actinacidiphila acididurans TaxID=2784346 RepID=A0ABS2TN92_9ACTN|nr:beta-galactosidase [Actinacidiphila acididurans]MBM9504292.1 beta-galactosidase [Actinacidiphila acididurans]